MRALTYEQCCDEAYAEYARWWHQTHQSTPEEHAA